MDELSFDDRSLEMLDFLDVLVRFAFGLWVVGCGLWKKYFINLKLRSLSGVEMSIQHLDCARCDTFIIPKQISLLIGISQRFEFVYFYKELQKNQMTFYMPILEYFLSISVSVLLLYNFLTTLLFCFQKALWKAKKSVRILQKLLLVIIFIVMITYTNNIESIPPKMFVIPWIWGFLASHVFIIRKKRWLNELLGLGILLAITIVIFFKQADFIEDTNSNVYFLYLILGVILGAIFWHSVQDGV